MKLSDLLTHGQEDIRQFVADELRQWRHCAIWWHPKTPGNQNSVPAQQMRDWCRVFVQFAVAVLKRGEEIESAYLRWLNAHAAIYDPAHQPITDTRQAMRTSHGVPQVRFLDRFNHAVSELRRVEAETQAIAVGV